MSNCEAVFARLAGFGGLRIDDVEVASLRGASAEVRVTGSLGGEPFDGLPIGLVRENGNWKLEVEAYV